MQGNRGDTGSNTGLKTLWIASLKPIAQSKDIAVRILPSAATWHTTGAFTARSFNAQIGSFPNLDQSQAKLARENC
jgi:hypothetical protein